MTADRLSEYMMHFLIVAEPSSPPNCAGMAALTQCPCKRPPLCSCLDTEQYDEYTARHTPTEARHTGKQILDRMK
jgi:hypothetical protein